MLELRQRIAEASRAADTHVLLGGESGTGKGVVARAITAASRRAQQPLLTIDCVSLPMTLAESELFGYERGAFTGASERRIGKLEGAGQGTVFLDEIGDMELCLQGKLLRVLEERVFERIGGLRSIALEARVIAATNCNLEELVAKKRFRLDLYHRLSTFPIVIPPLRERGEDVLLIARHFAEQFARGLKRGIVRLADETCALLMRHSWPGNVRELRNVIERAVVMASDAEIGPMLLPERIRLAAPSEALASGALPSATPVFEFRPGVDSIRDFEQRLVTEVMRLTGGNRTQAARLLGISRFSLLRRTEKLAL
jgi:transcriptional regulator with GAF, ATPase, and Fis domain